MSLTDEFDVAAELVAAYALDAVEGPDRTAAERALFRHPQLRDELDEFHAVLGVLATAVDPHPSTPSPRVWEGITREIVGGEPIDRDVAVVTLRSQRRMSRLSTLLSVAAITLASVLSFGVYRLATDNDASPIDREISALLNDPTAEVVTLTAVQDSSPSSAHIVLGADGVGYVYADTLPALNENRTYQLWAIVDDRVISAGVLGADPGVAPFQVVGAVAGFAITEEVAGGVPVSEGDTVATWIRDA